MISIPRYEVKQASRVYGDFTEKVAFNLNIDPTAVMSSLAGGYAATRVHSKMRDKQIEKEQKPRTIENGAYGQVESILSSLKIVFTPINVLFSVNGQVFDIIKVEEMPPRMKQAFIQQDSDYFRNLLVNKINMEVQLAEQAFIQRLIAQNGYGQQKEASHIAKQDVLTKLAEEEFEPLVKTASKGLEQAKLNLRLSFDSLRPFEQSEPFVQPEQLQKVANVFGLFGDDREESIDVHRLNHEVNVGFLPDRVVYLWNGQLIEQLTVSHMNEEGYAAFRDKNKQFFIDLFKQYTANTFEQTQEEVANMEQTASFTGEVSNIHVAGSENVNGHMEITDEESADILKVAAALEDIVDELVEDEFPVMERETIDIFQDDDIHPLVYDRVLASRYGVQWSNYEMEALIKQLEIDFKLTKGVDENPLNKISILRTLSSADHAMYQTPLTFEKFIRGVNSKSILFDQFQGNVSFEEIMFALEVAKSYDTDEVFFEFHDNIAPYVSEELMQEGVRFVSKQLYDETNPSEKDFFDSVNSYLMRKWKEQDTRGLIDDEEIDRQHIMSEQIVEIANEILSDFADEIEVDDPYTSVEEIIDKYDFLDVIPSSEASGVKNMIKENVVAHLLTAIFIEYKQQELEYLLSKLEEEGVIRERVQ